MSIECITWLVEHSQSKGTDRLVLMSIAFHADPRGNNTWPSLDTISREANVSRRAVCYSVGALVAIGELEVIQGGGRGRSNSYRMTLQAGRNSANDDRNSATVAPFPETVQNKTVQTTTETVQTTTLNSATLAPEPSLTVIEPSEEKKTKRARESVVSLHAPIAVPTQLEAFDAILRESGNGHYSPTSHFYTKVAEKYGGLDLEEEALKLTGWLQTEKAKRLKRTCNTAFILNWLSNAKEDVSGQNGSVQLDTGRIHPGGSRRSAPEQMGVGEISPFARFGKPASQA